MIGRTLLHYEFVSELGAGGMGRVFLARDTRTGRRVAVKFVDHADPGARERLQREAQAAARLSHPGIVTLYSLEDDGGQLFLVQEYVEGSTLAARIARGPLGSGELLRLAREVSAALAHAHRHGVLHRDLKPENILMAADGAYKIADFGIARVQGATRLTSTGAIPGTLPYLAPERLRGAAGDGRSDLFALGAVLYEAFTGRRAFPGATEAEVVYGILNADPLPPDAPSASLRPLAALTMKLLAREPAERPASAEEVAGLIEGLATVAGAATPGPVSRASRRIAALAVAAVLAIGALAGWWFVRQRPSAPDEASAVAVVAFDNVADPADPSRMGPITGNLIVAAIAQAPGANVLSTQRVLEVLSQLGRQGGTGRTVALEVGRRAHAARVVTGSILQLAPTIIMTAEVSDVRSGRLLAAERIEGRPGQTVFEVVDALGGNLLRRLLPAGAIGTLAPIAERTSADLAAQREYSVGLEHMAAGELEEAETAFQMAVDRDSTFAQACYQLAITHWWLREIGGAADAMARASALTERLTPFEREVVAGVSELVEHRFDSAAARFAGLMRAHPGDRTLGYAYEEAVFHSLRYPETVETARALLAADPGFTLAGIHLVDALAVEGELGQAESTAVELLDRSPNNRPLRRSLFYVRLRRGDLPGAFAAVSEARTQGHAAFGWLQTSMLLATCDSLEAARDWMVNGAPSGARWERDPSAVDYWHALRQGRFRAAMEIAREAWMRTPRLGSIGSPGVPQADGISAAVGARDLIRAQAFADSLGTRMLLWRLPNGALVGPLMSIDIRLRLGLTAEAAARLAALEKRPGGRAESARRIMAFARVQLLTAQGRGAEALALLPHATWYGDPVTTLGMTSLETARAHVAAGRPGIAIGILDTLIRAPMLSPDEAVRLRLLRARLLEKVGRPELAVRDYRDFLADWKDADPGLPEVAEARGAVRRLEGGPGRATPGGSRPERRR